ncbi:unnamed protein product, partial [Meganyctiphanes norvegica]
RMLLMCQDSRRNIHLSTSKPFIGKMHNLGLWNIQRFSSWDKVFPDRFSNFAGTTLHVSSNIDDIPFVFMAENEFRGVSKNIMDALGTSLNFTYTLIEGFSDGNWGGSQENGVWKGMLGDVFR